MNWNAIAILTVAAAAPLAARSETCALHGPDAASMKQEACLACHSKGALKFLHPVDVSYADVRAASPDRLRPLEEVTKRGVALPSGEVRCTTCHDGRSPWAHYIALPAGAKAVAPFDRTRPDAEPKAPPPGSEVSSKPLCLACHVND